MEQNAPKIGYVYILTNPSFREDWVKIGKSSRPVDVRSKELDNTAIPLPFEIYAVMETVKYNEVEKLVHKSIERFVPLRIRPNREFFNVKPEVALQIFKDIADTIDDARVIIYDQDRPITETVCSSNTVHKARTKNIKFTVNGVGQYSKRRAAFEALKMYVQTVRPKFSELQSFLADKDLSNWIKPNVEIQKENENDKQWEQRWKFNEPLMSSDGIEFLVSLELGDNCPLDFEKIRKVAERWGYRIEPIQ